MGAGDCILPPVLQPTSRGLFVSDSWFVDFTGDGLPEIPLGRLPVMTDEELSDLVQKIIAYESAPAGDWQNRVLLAADDPDSAGDFTFASDVLADLFPDTYDVVKAYLAVDGLDVTRATIQGIEKK